MGDKIISAFAFETASNIENLINQEIGKVQAENIALQAKIMLWYSETKDEEFAKHFNITSARMGEIKPAEKEPRWYNILNAMQYPLDETTVVVSFYNDIKGTGQYIKNKEKGSAWFIHDEDGNLFTSQQLIPKKWRYMTHSELIEFKANGELNFTNNNN